MSNAVPKSPEIRTTDPAVEVAWFSALCSDDYEFLGVPDGDLRSSFEHCSSLVKRADELGVSKEEAIESFLKEERPFLTLGRRGRVEEVAPVIALLCSDRASFTVGSAYRIDGGSVGAMNI